ncbi:MAG: DNA mismatch repair endonuclease MutL [Ruminococcus sp.]|nr:DNA mismatch repair endonuclease MutL [Ruminococcus sp.]
MGVINVLDKHVAELIAAGEVVERPSSVIKELVENSIDAGAKNITVEIKNGGTTFMRVTDDGCGFYREDIKLAFLRHATSKVKSEYDLDSISTLGFRGEALASISAVARLQLITRNASEDLGTCYVIEGGEEVSFEDAGCPVGTTFVIRDLFYNIPARSKFLKKDTSEGNAVSAVIDRIALSHPEISFTLIRDGKQTLKTFGDGKLLSAIYSVFGRDFANGLIPVDYQLDSITVKGYISKPVNARANRNMQNFFINGRYVRTRTGMAAIEEACKGSVMVGKFPACVLQLTLPYEIIDVNVHPAKIEVRFINERPVFDAIYHAVKTALHQGDERKKVVFKENTAFNDIKKINPFQNANVILKNQPEKKPEPQKAENKPVINPEKIKPYNPFDELDDKIFTAPQKSKENIDSLSFSDSGNPFSIYSKKAIEKSNSLAFNKKSNFVPETKTKRESPVVEEKFTTEINKTEDIVFTENISDKKPEPLKLDVVTPDKIKVEENIKEEITIIPKEKNDFRFIGEAFDTYIIIEKNNKEILLIDKHAAHERMLYEKLKKDGFAENSQLLLQPLTVLLSKEEYDAAINNLDMFKKCSFDVEDFGDGTLLVRSAPQYLDAADISDCITEMCGHIANGKKDIYTEKMDWFYHNVACRSAIKAGNKSTPAELIDIAKKLEENPELKYCPHGRPICVVMTKYDIEKQFGRV